MQVFYYEVQVKFGEIQWSLEKRYSEFNDLTQDLKKKFVASQIPKLPGKTMMKVKKPEALEKRREQLQEYMRTLTKMSDVRHSGEFRKFLEIDIRAPSLSVNLPEKMGNVSDPFKMGVGFMQLIEKQSLLFTGEFDMQIGSRTSQYVTKMHMPWKKETESMTLSIVRLFKLRMGQEATAEQLWEINFPQLMSCLRYHADPPLLFVGLEKGDISAFKLKPSTFDLAADLCEYEHLFKAQAHSGRVTGITYLKFNNSSVSCGEDKKMIVMDCLTQGIMNAITVGSSGLTNMVVDAEANRIMLSNKQGQIFLYDLKQSPPLPLGVLQAEKKGVISHLIFDSQQQLMFAGFTEGYIACFEMKGSGKEQFSVQIATYNTNEVIRSLCWRGDRKELIASNKRGILRYINTVTGKQFLAFPAHERSVKDIIYIELGQVLITCSKDKTLKFFRMPVLWGTETEDDLGQGEEMHRNTTSAPQKVKGIYINPYIPANRESNEITDTGNIVIGHLEEIKIDKDLREDSEGEEGGNRNIESKEQHKIIEVPQEHKMIEAPQEHKMVEAPQEHKILQENNGYEKKNGEFQENYEKEEEEDDDLLDWQN